MEDETIMVSIHCLAFNHAKYIRKTLEGFISQQTNFRYEVLIHDDASTDGTQDIIKEYEKKYPDIIKPIYQKENQFSKKIGILPSFNLPRAKGKYIAFCEGDDYWFDPHKLQKQVDILEQHPECSLCTHFVEMIAENGKRILGSIPATSLGKGVIEEEDYLRYEFINGWASQTSSYLIPTKYLIEYYEENPLYHRKMNVGDFPRVLYLITKGKVFFCNDTMSCYRVKSQGSYGEKRAKDTLLNLRHFYTLIDGMAEYNKYTNYQYDRLIKAYIVGRLEEVPKVERKLIKEYDAVYFDEAYQGKARHIRHMLRRRMPYLYLFLLNQWNTYQTNKRKRNTDK